VDFTPSPRSQDHLSRARAFIKEYIAPVEEDYFADLIAKNRGGDWTKWKPPR